jgi:uncharacterized protein (DUF1778 family)
MALIRENPPRQTHPLHVRMYKDERDLVVAAAKKKRVRLSAFVRDTLIAEARKVLR